MSSTFVCGQTLSTETCCNCGVLFAMPADWQSKFRETHQTFYCPAGHGQHYLRETEAERLKREVAQLQTRIEHKDARIADVVGQCDSLERQRNGMKGALVSVQRRVKNGVCPCCKRSFSCLAAHMKTKHPGYACASVK